MSEGERYNEQEVALILRRAAEAQPGGDMSLDEVEAIADEAGIDRALVRRAAREVELEKQSSSAPALPVGGGAFGPSRLVYERTIDGVLDRTMWDDLIAEIRRHLDLGGGAESIGRELVWSTHTTPESPRKIRVIVTPRAGKTLVRVEENTAPLAGGLYGGIMGGAGMGGLGWIIPVSVAALNMPILIPFLFAGWVFLTYLVSRTIFRNILSNRQPQLEGLANGLTQLGNELAAREHPKAKPEALPPGS